MIAREVFVTDIKQNDRGMEFYVLKNASYDPAKIAPFVASKRGAVKLLAGAKPCFIYRFAPNKSMGGHRLLDTALKMCEDMKNLL